jgi:hypothetical protein
MLVRGKVGGRNTYIGGLEGSLKNSDCMILGCNVTEIFRSTLSRLI